MKKEIWKDIEGYEGCYQVSDLGRVKSLKWGKERILNAGHDGGGYLIVGLCKNGKQKVYKPHQLVAIYFHNHTPCGMKLVVHHKNENITDNRAVNLEIVTNRDNISKSKTGYSSKHIGVYWVEYRGRWAAQISIDGKSTYIGYYKKEIDASNAYQDKLKTLCN